MRLPVDTLVILDLALTSKDAYADSEAKTEVKASIVAIVPARLLGKLRFKGMSVVPCNRPAHYQRLGVHPVGD